MLLKPCWEGASSFPYFLVGISVAATQSKARLVEIRSPPPKLDQGKVREDVDRCLMTAKSGKQRVTKDMLQRSSTAAMVAWLPRRTQYLTGRA